MDSLKLSVIQWHCMQWLKQRSLPVVIAITLIVLSVLSYLVQIVPMLDEVEHTQQEITLQLEKQSRPAVRLTSLSHLPSNQSVSEKVTQFYARFPTADSLPDMLENINLAAESHRLTLDKGDYKLKLLKTRAKKNSLENTLLPYEITLPIQGNYRDIRTFISELLSNMPMLAITDVQMQRDRIESRAIEARLRLVLFFSSQTKEES